MRFTAVVSVLVIFSSLIFSGCKKEGLGGEATIVAFPRNNGTAVPNTILYIKYGTREFPGEDPSAYDDSKVAVADMGEDPHAHFENLNKGENYIYGVGFDSSIHQVVRGGVPVTISSKAGETDVTVPLTEN